MPAPYNLTGLNNTNFLEKMVVINNAIDGWLALGLVLVIFFTLLFVMKNYETKRVVPVVAFLTAIIGTFMFVANLLQFQHLVILIVVTAVSSIILVLGE